jgi:hypothetical protein
MIVFDEYERIWRYAAMAYFKVLNRNSPGGTKEDHEYYFVTKLIRVHIMWNAE